MVLPALPPPKFNDAAPPRSAAEAPESKAAPNEPARGASQGHEGQRDDDQHAKGQPAPTGEREERNKAPPGRSARSAYEEPEWRGVPEGNPYTMEVIKGGVKIQTIPISERSCYIFGRQPDCDIVLDHPSSSRVHAVLQYRSDGASFIYDNKSTHGTFVNKQQLKGLMHAPLRVGDVVRFGQSSRLHIFQGPEQLMPKEGPNRQQKQQLLALEAAAKEKFEKEQIAKLSLANEEATWGIGEDHTEPVDEGMEGEVDWRSKFEQGKLTEKQSAIAEKIQRKERTMANLKKEIENIRAKESSQSLTEGQQMQIGRNEQKLVQLQEEIDEAEDVLTESVNESYFAKHGKKRKQKQKKDEDELSSDDDEFYDRTGTVERKKRAKLSQVESIETLWEKHTKLMEEKERLSRALDDKVRIAREVPSQSSAEADSLDAYLDSVKADVKRDQVTKVQQELDNVQKEIDSVKRLMQVADPSNLYKPRQKVASTGEKPAVQEQKEKPATAHPVSGVKVAPKPPVAAISVPSSEEEVQNVVPPDDGFMDRAAIAAEVKGLDKHAGMKRIGQLEIRQKPGNFKAPQPVLDRPDADNAFSAGEQRAQAKILEELNLLRGAHRMPDSSAGDDLNSGGSMESTWVPPRGQTGDGKTTMNNKLGY